MCQAIILLTASVPLLAGSPLWPSSCRSHFCPVSAKTFMCDWNIVNCSDATRVRSQVTAMCTRSQKIFARSSSPL